MKKDILKIKPKHLVLDALIKTSSSSEISQIIEIEETSSFNDIKNKFIDIYGVLGSINKFIDTLSYYTLEKVRQKFTSETAKRVTKILNEQGITISHFDVEVALSIADIIADDVNLCVDDLGTPHTPEEADHSSCPKCDGCLDFGKPIPEGTKIIRTHTCSDCGFSYTEEYTLTKNYEEL